VGARKLGARPARLALAQGTLEVTPNPLKGGYRGKIEEPGFTWALFLPFLTGEFYMESIRAFV
jgi:hypothetical protein